MRNGATVSLYVLSFTLYALLLSLTPQSAHAHGGGTAQIVNEPIGDFIITVWMNPDPPQVGKMHLTIGLALNQEPVLNQEVRVEIVHQSGNRPNRNALATHENSSSRFLYEADIEVPASGDWRVDVSVGDVTDTVSFVAPVEAASFINRPTTAIAAFALVGVTFAYGIVSGRKRGR